MISNRDENTTQPDDENAVRVRVIPLESVAFNGSVGPAAQANSLMHMPVTSKRGKLRYPRSVMLLSAIGLAILGGGIFLLLSFLMSPPRVVAYRTHMQNVNLSIGGSGIVHASQELHLSSPLVAQVTNIYVKPGDRVTANQPLLQLDLPPQQAFSPTLHNGALIAPFNGVVTAVTVQNGELVKAKANLVTLQSDETVVAHIQVPLASLAHVFANQDVLVTPSAIPNLTVHGTVSSIIPKSSAATDTFEVWVTIDNSAKQLLLGMNVLARLQKPLRTLIVPRLAVINPDQGATVFVIKNRHVSLRHVQTAGYVGDQMVIEAGLSEGDEVALTGVDRLQDGQAVDIIKVQS